MKRSLIAVGCNAYEHLTPLRGAELDATRVFDQLILKKVGDYDEEASQVLISPTLADLQQALTAALFSGTDIDTFTFFFAGHGAVKTGSFFMCVNDTRREALSATAFSISDLFLRINEAQPSQTNVVIDACESGGLVSDLNALLKSEVLGDAGTPGITLLATSARDQYSEENEEGGLGTTALLECITGETFVHDAASTLDLIEIGRKVSERISVRSDQTPVVWGLNLYGPPRFCRNPHYHAGGDVNLRQALAWRNREAATIIHGQLPALWESYFSVDRDWNARKLANALSPVLESLVSQPPDIVSFVERLSDALAERAARTNDVFREIEVLATCAVTVLPYSRLDASAKDYLERTSGKLAGKIEGVVEQVIGHLGSDKYALLSEGGGLADLYYLPIRVTRILGWAAAAAHIRDFLGTKPDTDNLNSLFGRVLALYCPSLVAMSETQAPFAAAALTAAARLGVKSAGETFASLLFHSALNCKGRVADPHLEPSKVLPYLLARQSGNFEGVFELVAQPTEFVLVLLRAATLFNLEDVFDDAMWELDHTCVNAYIADDYAKFGENMITGGVNATYMIGHDIWRVGELIQAWPTNADKVPEPAVACGALLASLVYPDRTPWFLFAAVTDDVSDAGQPHQNATAPQRQVD